MQERQGEGGHHDLQSLCATPPEHARCLLCLHAWCAVLGFSLKSVPRTHLPVLHMEMFQTTQQALDFFDDVRMKEAKHAMTIPSQIRCDSLQAPHHFPSLIPSSSDTHGHRNRQVCPVL